NSFLKNFLDKFNIGETALYTYLWLTAFALMFISITLASASFLTVAYHDIMVCDEIRRKVYVDHHLFAKNDRILISR
ncbi:MAG TPA: hypothetical protein VK255_00445, partial [Patescibacteria group bacterium]|nr:hypothetical protein [Patescibacteria group bacterium]